MRALAACAAAMLLLIAPAGHAQQFARAGLSQSDRAEGAQAYRQIVKQFGGKVNGPLADYVRQVGLKVALVSVPGSRPQDWTITLLNSPVPNAMATPGGYLYITRGLLGMINSEAELASVLGHEAGHVSGQHSDKRESRAVLAGLGTALASVFLGPEVGQVADLTTGMLVSGYSRGQENDADLRGLRYAAAAGYDPRAAASMLQALERVSLVEGKEAMERGGLQSFFSTHPVTADRVKRVAAAAAKMPPGGRVERDAFLSAISGMTFGNSADQGIISGPSFRHAGLGLGFDAPPGFRLQNSATALTGQGRDGALFQFSPVAARSGQPLEPVVAQVWNSISGGQRPQVRIEETMINGFEAAVSSAQVRSNGLPVEIGVTAIRGAGGQVFVLATRSAAGRDGQFDGMRQSLRKLSPQESATASRARRIEVVTVKPGDTVRGFAARMAPPYNREASFLALNGIPNRPLAPGERLKLIVW